MIVTETEAKQLACPFARDFRAQDYGAENYTTPVCLATGCMSWEFVDGEWLYANQVWDNHPSGIPRLVEIQRMAGVNIEPDFDWYKVNDQQAFAAGWELAPNQEPGKGTKTMIRYRRRYSNRTGQCGRTVIISIDKD